MAQVRACLIDVYETILSCDFAAHATDLPALAGVAPQAWNSAFEQLAPEVTDGRLTMAETYHRVLRAAGVEATPDLVCRLVALDQELLVETSRLHDDTVPFLAALRDRGILSAFVSNCAENTRPLLADLDLLRLVDAAVLSCEVGHAKPDAGIFAAALTRLDVPAGEALLVDDQPAYCAGAAEQGMSVVQIRRDGSGERSDPGGWPVVSSLHEVEALL